MYDELHLSFPTCEGKLDVQIICLYGERLARWA